jgi:hypothetical protein
VLFRSRSAQGKHHDRLDQVHIISNNRGLMERTVVKDLVLIHFEDKPMTFARIEDIRDDWKKGWYHVTFLFLQIPFQVVTWILRDRYIDGDEFTMNGNRIRIEKVISPYKGEPEVETTDEKPSSSSDQSTTPAGTQKGNVISLNDFKK